MNEKPHQSSPHLARHSPDQANLCSIFSTRPIGNWILPHDSLPECEIDFLVDDAASERDGSYSVARHTATQLKSIKPGPSQPTT